MRSHRRNPAACSRLLDVAHTLRLPSDDGKAEQKADATFDPDVLGTASAEFCPSPNCQCSRTSRSDEHESNKAKSLGQFELEPVS